VTSPVKMKTEDGEQIVIPRNGAELEVMLGDQKLMEKLLTKEPEKFGEFISNYAQYALNQQQDIAAQVREQTQMVLHQMMEDGGLKLDPDKAGKYGPPVDLTTQARSRGSDGAALLAQKQGLYNSRAMGAAIDNEFESAGDYFQTIWHQRNGQRDHKTENKIHRVRNAFSSNVPSEGGFLIPETMRSEMLRIGLETAIVRPRARVIPMESLRVPFPAIDSTSNASSVYGGVIAYWTEEGATLQQSSAQFSRVVLDAKKLTAYTAVPNELLADSIISFEAFINQIFPEALTYYEDDAFINGTGVGEPLGFLDPSNASMISVAKEGGQAADTIVWENIIAMYARMLPTSLNRAAWIVAPNVFPQLATMALSVGTGGVPVWLPDGTNSPSMQLLGRPVIVSEKVPKLGDAGDINLVDLSYYLIGDRQVMSAMSSQHYLFQNDMTAYRIIERLDGRPWLQSALTPRNGGDTLSPFVSLAERA
jgi:HK97 family phage major capsid protein